MVKFLIRVHGVAWNACSDWFIQSFIGSKLRWSKEVLYGAKNVFIIWFHGLLTYIFTCYSDLLDFDMNYDNFSFQLKKPPASISSTGINSTNMPKKVKVSQTVTWIEMVFQLLVLHKTLGLSEWPIDNWGSKYDIRIC